MENTKNDFLNFLEMLEKDIGEVSRQMEISEDIELDACIEYIKKYRDEKLYIPIFFKLFGSIGEYIISDSLIRLAIKAIVEYMKSHGIDTTIDMMIEIIEEEWEAGAEKDEVREEQLLTAKQ